MPKVYIPNRGAKHDFSPAEEFGELVYVSDGYLSPMKTGHIHRMWEEALKDSSPDDWILICSLNVVCSIGTAIFTAKHGCYNLLLYRSKTNRYEPRRHKIGE